MRVWRRTSNWYIRSNIILGLRDKEVKEKGANIGYEVQGLKYKIDILLVNNQHNSNISSNLRFEWLDSYRHLQKGSWRGHSRISTVYTNEFISKNL